MSQAGRLIASSGPGSGTVTSITFNGGLTSTPDPITTTGTATLDQTNLTVLDGTVYWDTGTQRLNTTATGSSGQVLTSNGVGLPPTYQAPGTASITLTADTGGPLVSNSFTLAGGTNISTAGAGTTITFNATGFASFSWSVITANQTAAVNHGYFCNKAGTLVLALPAVSAVGDTIEVSNINAATGTQFTQAAGQQIFISNTSTTIGATGTLTSSLVGDSLRIVCRVANLTWQTVSMVGSWTPA